MRKIGLILTTVLALAIIVQIALCTQSSPEKVLDILKHWSIAWLKVIAIMTTTVAIIFAINKWIKKEGTMSIVGLCILPVLIPAMLTLAFGSILLLNAIGIGAGLILGYFSYIIDDHIVRAWDVRHVTLPIFLGLGFGISVAVAIISENWQDEYMYVTDHSTCTEVTIERYTMHTRSNGKTTTTYYSWDAIDTKYVFASGEAYPTPIENVHYTLGTGAFGKSDRIDLDYHKWIGGHKLNKSGTDLGFKWIALYDNELVYEENTVYEVEENFFGHAIHNGKVRDIEHKAFAKTKSALPTSSDVISGIGLTFDFVKIMATNPEFSILRWIYALVYLPFLLAIFFIEEIRISFLLFLAASTVVILIILAAAAARFDGFRDILEDHFHGRGGRSGGAGASSHW